MNFNVNELTLDNVGKWPLAIKWIVIVIMSLIILGMGYQLIISPSLEEYHALLAKQVTLKTEFETLQHQASNFHAYQNQIHKMEERFGKMLKQLPTKNEMPGLLEDISKTGTASGLTFSLFAPEQEIQHDLYIELPIQIIVAGNYQQLAVFLSRVAQMSRIVTLHDFVIEKPDLDKSNADPLKTLKGDQLSMKITATIYRYRIQ